MIVFFLVNAHDDALTVLSHACEHLNVVKRRYNATSLPILAPSAESGQIGTTMLARMPTGWCVGQTQVFALSAVVPAQTCCHNLDGVCCLE